jgi:NAD(P)-dependent dehydrogenase (short-subunit alcohol dehydrogenase family)
MTASLAYNASKAAAAMMTKQMAHELGPEYGITVFGVSPNKLAGTVMSAYTAIRIAEIRGWHPEEVARRQAAALPARKETPVRLVAEFVAWLLTKKERHEYLQGCILNYGGP